MKVLIFYEHLSREWDAVQGLKRELEKDGCQVYVCSIIYEMIKSYRIAKKNKIDVLIVPWLDDKIHEKYLSPILDSNEEIVVINLHQEQVSCEAFMDSFVPQTDFCRNGCYHFSWGGFFREFLLNNGVDSDKVYITGNMRNDYSTEVLTTKRELSEKYDLTFEKKWILFAENRGWMNQRNKEVGKQELINKGFKREDIEQSIEYGERSLRVFFEKVNEIEKSFFDKYELIYRPHPGTICSIENSLPEGFHIIGDLSIYDWIKNIDLFLTCESTSIFEADICGKPAFRLDYVDEPERLRMCGVWDYYKLDDFCDVSRFFEGEIIYERKKIYEEYIGEVDGGATKRTAEGIYSIIKSGENNKQYNKQYKYERLSKQRYLKLLAWETMTYCIVKLGLMDCLKFPRSAYIEKRDIPYSKENVWINKRDNK